MDPIDEDIELRQSLAALGPGALAELQQILEGSADYRREILIALMASPNTRTSPCSSRWPIPTKVVRLRLLQAIRDVGP